MRDVVRKENVTNQSLSVLLMVMDIVITLHRRFVIKYINIHIWSTVKWSCLPYKYNLYEWE